MAIWALGLLVSAGGRAEAWNAARRAAAEVARAEVELERLAGDPRADAARGEIVLLEGWTDEARKALGRREHRRAAVLAERLPRQVSLIRALLALAEEEARARRLEDEAARLRLDLAVQRARLDRLALRRSGRAATSAFPPLAPPGGSE